MTGDPPKAIWWKRQYLQYVISVFFGGNDSLIEKLTVGIKENV